eukprot:gene23437-29655_t
MEVKEKLETHLTELMDEWFALPRVSLIHGDPNVGNFMRTNNGDLRLLDWEMSGSNHRLVDVAAFIASNELTKEEEALFLHTYYTLDGNNTNNEITTSSTVPTSPEEVFRSLPLSYAKESSLLWLFKIRRLFALIGYFVMLFSKTPVNDATEEKRMMLQATLDSFVCMFADCVDEQLEVDVSESEVVEEVEDV